MIDAVQIPTVALPPGAADHESAYRRLRAAIMQGLFAPGATLTMRGLAGAMDTSATPVREAVRRLSSEHAIEVQDNRRMRIPAMSAARFEEIVDLRITLEARAAVRALPWVRDVDIEAMERIDARLDEAVERDDQRALTVLNHDFHRRLYAANPVPAAIPLIESVWLQLGPFQRQVIESSHLAFYLVDRHHQIVASLRARDPVALAEATEADIRDGIYRAGRALLAERDE